MFLAQPNALTSTLYILAIVEVKFSREVVIITEGRQVNVTVVAMGDLSSALSIIVMAINGTAFGKLVSRDLYTVQMCTTSAVVCSFILLTLRFKFLSQKTVILLGICGE